MTTYKLEKKVKLYKNQFEKMCSDIFQSYIIDRTSIELDGILFRIKYMTKHNRDLDKLPKLEEEFNSKSTKLRQLFSRFVSTFLREIIKFDNDKYSYDDIKDILTLDVKMDAVYITFTMVLISDNLLYLNYVSESIPDDEVYNMFPNEFFRVYTDSYNDGIMKAFPELFTNRQQDQVGTGADKDVFVHNFTFQTTERCSLNCTYCLTGDTMIRLEDCCEKQIKDIVVGDPVLSIHGPARVKNVWISTTDEYYVIKTNHKNGYRSELHITGEHPILTTTGWIEAKYIRVGDRLLRVHNDGYPEVTSVELVKTEEKIKVYNLETDGTYYANGFCVHNCYQFNKSPMRMSFGTARKFIDDLLDDRYGYINRYNSPAIIIEFIGGEPLLEIELTRQIYEYFLEQCYERDHPWFTLHRLSICSNGLQYFDKEVQDFFKAYATNISFNISIDGNKELHDACRIQPNGEGSYDIAMAALNHYNQHYTPERNSKMTLAPSNIKYLFDSVVDFINHGMNSINLNCIFEEGWDQSTALEEYNQLKKLADYILENNLEHLFIAIFNERQEDVQNKHQDGNFCGGLGSMLALRPNGDFYPCIRYMPTSVGPDVPDLCIGNIDIGIIGREQDSEILKMMDNITRRSQSNDICFECPIGNDCAWCSALAHTVYGTPDKRPMFTCIQMIAEALANVYYWNLLNIKHPEYNLKARKNNVPDKWALLVIDKEELEYLKSIETYSMMITFEKSGDGETRWG